MTMFNVLTVTACIFIAAHILLLSGFFSRKKLITSRYAYAHFALWSAGLVAVLLASCFATTGQNVFVAFFNTPLKRTSIIFITFGLSIFEHAMVRWVILPSIRKS